MDNTNTFINLLMHIPVWLVEDVQLSADIRAKLFYSIDSL